MQAIYDEASWLEESERCLQKFFNEFWIENQIRPEKIVQAFLQKGNKIGDFLPYMTPVQWLSYFSGFEYTK